MTPGDTLMLEVEITKIKGPIEKVQQKLLLMDNLLVVVNLLLLFKMRIKIRVVAKSFISLLLYFYLSNFSSFNFGLDCIILLNVIFNSSPDNPSSISCSNSVSAYT